MLMDAWQAMWRPFESSRRNQSGGRSSNRTVAR
jgi:hypothetical protein